MNELPILLQQYSEPKIKEYIKSIFFMGILKKPSDEYQPISSDIIQKLEAQLEGHENHDIERLKRELVGLLISFSIPQIDEKSDLEFCFSVHRKVLIRAHSLKLFGDTFLMRFNLLSGEIDKIKNENKENIAFQKIFSQVNFLIPKLFCIKEEEINLIEEFIRSCNAIPKLGLSILFLMATLIGAINPSLLQMLFEKLPITHLPNAFVKLKASIPAPSSPTKRQREEESTEKKEEPASKKRKEDKSSPNFFQKEGQKIQSKGKSAPKNTSLPPPPGF